jgi:hypothetical protein
VKHPGTGLRVGQIKKLHLTKLEGALTGDSSSTTVFRTLPDAASGLASLADCALVSDRRSFD